MRTRKDRNSGSSWLICLLLVTMIDVEGPSAFASSNIQQAEQANLADASSSDKAYPDAPSSLMSAAGLEQVGPSRDLPLERQDHPQVTLQTLPPNILRDGAKIAVSPMYLRKNDLKWLLPLTAISTAAFATDPRVMTDVVSSNPSFNQTNVDVSNGLVGGLVIAPVAMFGIGQLRHSGHMKETGMLGAEAMVDAFVVDQVIKLCSFRERPIADNSQGEFYIGKAGADSSFVSAHSMVAWSSAAVIAGEYPSKWVQFGVYSLAAGVSATRVMGQQHFPSDVILGAAGGWLIGHYVFRSHHHHPSPPPDL